MAADRFGAVDRPSRLPTFWEALVGAGAGLALAALLFALNTPAAIAPLMCALALLGYALLKGLGWMLRRLFNG